MANAYCGECKAKKKIGNPRAGVLTLQGECPDCGGRVHRIGVWGTAFVLGGIGLSTAMVFLVYGIMSAAFLCTVWGFVAIAGGILMRAAENGSWRCDLDLRSVDLSSKYAVRERGFFEKWTALKPGETLRIVTDRDPKPLYHHVDGNHEERFEWGYEQYGPEDWVVNVRKR